MEVIAVSQTDGVKETKNVKLASAGTRSNVQNSQGEKGFLNVTKKKQENDRKYKTANNNKKL